MSDAPVQPRGSLAEAVSGLYGLAPSGFIQERNSLAAQAKSAGDRILSERIKGLAKPSIGVWLVNQLARHRPDDLARVLGLSEALRQAQDERDGDELRRLAKVRSQVLRDVIGSGRELGAELGQPISESIAGEVEQALRAALADENAAIALVSGQLVRGLESTGFGGVDLDDVLAASELAADEVLDAAIEPSTEGLGTPGSGGARASGHLRAAPAQKRPAEPARPGPAPDRRAEREEERRRKAQKLAADQAADDAVDAARAADQALADARHEADEVADQLEELAAELSRRRDQIRDLELAARQARRAARDADRARRHLGLVD